MYDGASHLYTLKWDYRIINILFIRTNILRDKVYNHGTK